MKNNKLSQIGLIGGIIIFLLIIIFGDLEPGKPEITFTFAIAILMAIWWITEAIPLAITSLLPVILFPLLGILDGKTISSTYFNHVIFLFIGGFIIALAMQKWNLHRRIALRIMIFTGTSPARILLGFMFATAFLSMWISNTATAMMMIPIAMSIIEELQHNMGKENMKRFTVGLLLGIAYSASIGGAATLVGTPPNLSFARIFQIYFPQAPEISFASWFVFAIPITILFFAIIWFYLFVLFKPKKGSWKAESSKSLKSQYYDLGKASFEERAVLIAFISAALLWLTRSDILIGSFFIPGWSKIFKSPEFINDGSIAIFISIMLFIIPSKNFKGQKLMDWNTAVKLPWNIVLLFGGGFALATGFKESGLSIWFGTQLSWVADAHPIMIILTIALMMTFLTELTSNTATTEMILPVLAGLSFNIGLNPLLLMIPATLSASMAFMLPVATPPNAIIFGTNKVSMIEMAKTGFVLNIIGAILITLATYYWGSYVFDIDMNVYPDWAILEK
ncbi:SLC13 family permease [Bacteroidota bacterium]